MSDDFTDRQVEVHKGNVEMTKWMSIRRVAYVGFPVLLVFGIIGYLSIKAGHAEEFATILKSIAWVIGAFAIFMWGAAIWKVASKFIKE